MGVANVFRMEADVTTSVLQLYATAERQNDVRSTVFLDGVIDEQRLSEHEAAYLLGRVKFAAGQRRNRKRKINLKKKKKEQRTNKNRKVQGPTGKKKKKKTINAHGT